MPTNNYNSNFLETPDPVTGLQRRTGQNFLDHKQTLHERLTLEHMLDPTDPSPQNQHGDHREGSAKVYMTRDGDADYPEPTNRPTGDDKNGTLIAALPLDVEDDGRVLIVDEQNMFVWSKESLSWIRVDTTPAGMIQAWASPLSVPPAPWLKCDGQSLDTTEYSVLFALLGYNYGGENDVFKVPDLSGVTIIGSGQLDYPEDGDPSGISTPTGRIKGDATNNTTGLYAEDELQTLSGDIFFMRSSDGTNIVRSADGIFEELAIGGANANQVSGWTNTATTQGFGINLDAAEVRNGVATRMTGMVMDYYIKAK